MTILYMILGVFLIIGGFSCMFTPLATLLSAGYFIGIMMLVLGVFGVVRCVKAKAGALGWITSILALIVGVFALVRPGSTLVIDSILMFLLAGFFVIEGVVLCVTSIQSRGVNNKWGWGLVTGILALILGIFSFAYPVFSAVTVGVLIGLWFVETGFSMIALGFALDEKKQ